MNGVQIAAIIGAVIGGGGLGAFISKLWSQKRLDKKQAVGNFQTLFNEISKDVGRVRDEQREERKLWADERQAFNVKIEKLSELIRTQDDTIHKKDLLVTELKGDVRLLQAKLELYQEDHSTPKNITIK